MNKLTLVPQKLYSLWNLEPVSRGLLLRGLGLLPCVALSLKCLGVKRTQAALQRLFPVSVLSLSEQELTTQIAKTARMVRIATSYYQPWANCLKKSLVLWSLLRQQGICSEVKIGVRRNAGAFEAHAWVERDGNVLNDVRDVGDRFAAFERSLDSFYISIK